LFNRGHHARCRVAERSRRRRHDPPTEQPLSFFGDDVVDDLPHRLALRRIAREKYVADTVLAGRRQVDAESARDSS